MLKGFLNIFQEQEFVKKKKEKNHNWTVSHISQQKDKQEEERIKTH